MVREAWDRNAKVGASVAAPMLVQVHPASTGDPHRREKPARLKIRAVDDDVRRSARFHRPVEYPWR